MIKSFLLDDKKIEKNSYIWNIAGGMLNAFQSVIMLMILTRTLGLVESGILTIAYANANLFLTIGKYGMRYFQVSDVKEQFTFSEYKSSRVITGIMMVLVSFVYVLYTASVNDYSTEKSLVIIWMCLFKLVDAVEDVYHGMYQQKNRLDVAAKSMTLRMLITIMIFGVSVVFLRDLLISLIIATFSTAALALLFIKWTVGEFHAAKEKTQFHKVKDLLWTCFPLFAGAFLSFYIGNAPKYAIDATLTDELQACYGFISMPVFVIGLLNNFIFNPMIYKMSILWNERKIKEFVFKTFRQILIVGAITLVCIAGAWLLGVPVLSWLYNTDLAPYKTELLILLLGGGFLGLSGLLNTVITIIRFQKSVMWGYAGVALLALLFSNRVVENYEMMGAAVLYTCLMALLCVVFLILFAVGILVKRNEKRG